MEKKLKFGEKIGTFFILSSTLEIYYIIDSPWKTYVIAVNMSKGKYQERFRKSAVMPNHWRELTNTRLMYDTLA